MSELKPCPFCAETDELDFGIVPSTVEDAYYITCDSCDANGPMGLSNEQSAELWNQRPTPTEVEHE